MTHHLLLQLPSHMNYEIKLLYLHLPYFLQLILFSSLLQFLLCIYFLQTLPELSLKLFSHLALFVLLSEV
ncbi:hypothetical protein CICLE_v10033265mg [Citrus x clementina]|uniref:Uncharacterized protein n=1 Tax=Citrus clementina TaxID=85681 RepID=V4VAF8_CITCL|nr:hypothetical protein CICLE_v10033265mg [Citrus x clementina]